MEVIVCKTKRRNNDWTKHTRCYSARINQGRNYACKSIFSRKSSSIIKKRTLLYEISNNLTSAGFGQNITIGIGGDPVNGTRMIDAFDMVKDDPELEAMVVVGEIGGDSEEILPTYHRYRI